VCQLHPRDLVVRIHYFPSSRLFCWMLPIASSPHAICYFTVTNGRAERVASPRTGDETEFALRQILV